MSNADDGGRPDDDAPPELTVQDTIDDLDAPEEFSPFDELHEDFKPIARKAFLADGLPSVVAEEEGEADAPPLSPGTLICMGVFDEFVLRDEQRKIVLRFPKESVEQHPDGAWRIPFATAVELFQKSLSAEEQDRTRAWAREPDEPTPEPDREIFSRALVRRLPGGSLSGTFAGDWLNVKPIRPPCRHYVRMRSQFELNAKHDVVYRLCAARRTTEGTFMTVRDRKVTACDMREPRDLESEGKFLDAFDAMKIQQGRERTMLPMFKDEQATKEP